MEEIARSVISRNKPLDRERWAQIKELFLRLIESAPSERVRILDEACGEDSEMRVEVESLLKYHHDSDVIRDSSSHGGGTGRGGGGVSND